MLPISIIWGYKILKQQINCKPLTQELHIYTVSWKAFSETVLKGHHNEDFKQVSKIKLENCKEKLPCL